MAFVPDTRHHILHKAEGPLPKQHEAQVAALLQARLPEVKVAVHRLHVLQQPAEQVSASVTSITCEQHAPQYPYIMAHCVIIAAALRPLAACNGERSMQWRASRDIFWVK